MSLLLQGGETIPLRAKCLRGGVKATGLFGAASRGPDSLGWGAWTWGLVWA